MIVEAHAEVSHPTTLRRAAAADRPALADMYARFEPKASALGLPPLRAEDRQRWLAGIERFPNFLAWSGDRLVGHGVICPDGDSAEVAVFVHQDFRGKGVGRLLLTELIAEAGRLRLRRIWGIAAPDNVAMLRLAHTCGFLPGEEWGEFYLLLP